MAGQMRVLMEIGNSTLKVACCYADGSIVVERHDSHDDSPASAGGLDVVPDAVVFTSQASPVLLRKMEWMDDGAKRPRIITRSDLLPFIGTSYDTPETIGPDRVLNLLGMEGDGVAVSCGTAITIDAVAGGVPFWGAIMPGFRTAAYGLHGRVPALPLVSPDDTPRLPARTSRDSVVNGILLGIAAAARGIVSILALTAFGAPPPRTVLTGGDAELMRRLWEPSDADVDDALLFRGMLRVIGEAG